MQGKSLYLLSEASRFAEWRSRSGNSKVHGNASFSPRLVMRFEAPLFDCLHRGGGQNVRTADHRQSLESSIRRVRYPSRDHLRSALRAVNSFIQRSISSSWLSCSREHFSLPNRTDVIH